MTSVVIRMVCKILAIQLVAALKPRALEHWLTSSAGLSMTKEDAETAVYDHVNALSQCGVDIHQLQALKNVTTEHNGIDLDLATLQLRLFHLAEQHVAPDRLRQLYEALYNGYAKSGGLGLPHQEAQRLTLDLALKQAEPDQLKELHDVMYGFSGSGFNTEQAQQTAIELAIAGASAAAYKDAYAEAFERSSEPNISQARADAAIAAVTADLDGRVRRYGKAARPYTAQEFMAYYPASWLDEWTSAPIEKRVSSSDGRAYTAYEFSKLKGSNWQDEYQQSAEAVQLRLTSDGKNHTMQDFLRDRGYIWQKFWAMAAELPCEQCNPYSEASLSAFVESARVGARRVRRPEVVV